MTTPPPSLALPWQFWRAFIDSIPAAIAVLDTSLCYVDVSQRWLDNFNQDRDKLIGVRIGTILPPLIWAMTHGLKDCLDGTTRRAEGEFSLPLDGQVTWFSWDAQPWHHEDGSVCGIIVYTKNITEQKQADDLLRASEQRFRTLFQYSPVAYLALDADGRYLDMNDELCRLLGVPAAQLIGQSFHGFWTENTHDSVCDILGDDRIKGELELRHADGHPITVLLVGRVQRDARHGFVMTHCILFDISERKSMERELARLNQVKTEFLTNMSHELRTPLNAINGFSYMIKEQSLGPNAQDKYRNYAEVIHDAGEHLLSLINDILDISSLEANRLPLHQAPADLSQIIRSCLTMLANMAETAGVSVTYDLAALPLLRLDSRRMTQVVVNLLSNALRFTPAGGRVRLETARQGDGAIAITVQDSGIGMDQAGIAIALEPFGQVDSGLQRTHEGMGLGLPLSKRFVELHGGSLTVQSTPGQGTTVRVMLPVDLVAGDYQSPHTA